MWVSVAVGVADDMKKLGKNQLALHQSFEYLQKKVKALERRVATLEGREPEPEPEPVKKKVEQTSVKETHKPIENLGFKIFGGVGFALILLGIFFLYRYAVDQGWIGILGRIVLGIVFSLVILGAAEVFRKKEYVKFSQLLTGGGLALLYFTFYATYAFREYREALGMTQTMNFVLLLVVMVVAVVLALRQDSMLLTCFAFLMGYLSPILIGIIAQSGNYHVLLIATLILSVGMAVILWKKNWPLGSFPVVISYLIYAFFFAEERVLRYTQDGTAPDVVGPAFVYLLLFWLLFSVLSLVLKDDKNHIQNILISVGNAFAFFGFGLAMVWEYLHSWRGLFVILIAAAYLFMAGLAKRRELKNLFETLFVLAITFLTITIPVQLQGAWITAAWALEGVLLLKASAKLKHNGLAILGYLVLGIGTLRLLFWDTWQLDYGWRTFSFLVVIAALAGGAYVLSRSEIAGKDEMKGVLGVGAALVLTVMLGVEILDRNGMFTNWTSNARQVLCSIAWAVEAIILIIAGFLNRATAFRITGLLLFGLVLVKILIFDLGALNDISRTIVTIIVGIIALVGAFVYVKNKEKIKAFLEEG